MAIVGGTELLKKISSQIESQFPSFIREEGPNFVAFLKAYFEYMEQSGNATDSIRSLEDLHDVDRTVNNFVEYFRREFLLNIPSSVLADKRLLTKHIIQFYNAKGSEESYRFLFRILFNKEIDFYYPGDDILRASDGRWVKETKIRVSKPYNKNPKLFEGVEIQGFDSKTKALVQSIISVRASGVLVYDMTVENVTGTFIDGERIYDSAGNYVTINSQIGPLSQINIVDGGAGHVQGDLLEIFSSSSIESATARITKTRSDSAVNIQLVNGGSGYRIENTELVVTGGTGTGFEAEIVAFNPEPISNGINTDLIGPMSNVVLDTSPTFVSLGANTADVSAGFAAANINSALEDVFSFDTSNFYSINAIAIINPGIGYTTLPNITIIDSNIAKLGTSDGYGNILGRNATLSVSHAPGTIETIDIISPGIDFNKNEITSIRNTTRGNSAITISSTGSAVDGSANTKYLITKTTFSGSGYSQSTGITVFPGRYIDTKGFLSWDNRLQDNYFYQEFSYVVRVNEQLDRYSEIIKKLVHPAGTKLFGHYVIRSKANVAIITTTSDVSVS